jgi:hypothetical protein
MSRGQATGASSTAAHPSAYHVPRPPHHDNSAYPSHSSAHWMQPPAEVQHPSYYGPRTTSLPPGDRSQMYRPSDVPPLYEKQAIVQRGNPYGDPASVEQPHHAWTHDDDRGRSSMGHNQFSNAQRTTPHPRSSSPIISSISTQRNVLPVPRPPVYATGRPSQESRSPYLTHAEVPRMRYANDVTRSPAHRSQALAERFSPLPSLQRLVGSPPRSSIHLAHTSYTQGARPVAIAGNIGEEPIRLPPLINPSSSSTASALTRTPPEQHRKSHYDKTDLNKSSGQQ